MEVTLQEYRDRPDKKFNSLIYDIKSSNQKMSGICSSLEVLAYNIVYYNLLDLKDKIEFSLEDNLHPERECSKGKCPHNVPKKFHKRYTYIPSTEIMDALESYFNNESFINFVKENMIPPALVDENLFTSCLSLSE